MTRADYAVAVIGGGPAGAVAARVLAQAGVDVLLVDARPPAGFRVGESLVPAARNILLELGLWERFLGSGHVPCYGNVAAWGSSELVEMDFIRSPYGHGWHLDRTRFDLMLQDMAVEAGATICKPARPTWFRRCETTWRVALQTLQGCREVNATWLLDCSGRSHRIARDLGVARRYADRLLALLRGVRRGDSDTLEGVRALERSLETHLAAGTPWLAHEDLDVLAVLDTPAWYGISGLLSECPVIPDVVTAIVERGTRGVDPKAFSFIASVADIDTIRAFVARLPQLLAG